MRHSGLWGLSLAVTVLGITASQASGAFSVPRPAVASASTWEASEVNLGNLPIERDRGIQLVHHHRRPRHVHYGGFGGRHQQVIRPIPYNTFYYGVPSISQQWRMYYGPGAFSHSYYRSYYGGFGGGCRTNW